MLLRREAPRERTKEWEILAILDTSTGYRDHSPPSPSSEAPLFPRAAALWRCNQCNTHFCTAAGFWYCTRGDFSLMMQPFYSSAQPQQRPPPPPSMKPLNPRRRLASSSRMVVMHHAFPWSRLRRAPAGHLCLKTNLPWVVFEEPSTTAAASGGGATGGAVGASGTTLVPPVGVIMPGKGCV